MADTETRKHRRRAPSARAAGIALNACEACRRKKTRCVAEQGETCKACKANGLVCTFLPLDGRRQGTFRDLIARIRELEQQLQSAQLSTGGELRGKSRDPGTAGTTLDRSTDINAALPSSILVDSAEPSSLYDDSSHQVQAPVEFVHSIPVTNKSQILNVRSVADRLSIEEDGNIRAYGPLSDHVLATVSPGFNDHIDHAANSELHSPPPCYSTPEPDRQRLLVAAASNIDSMPMGTDIRLVERLLVSFLLWHHTIFPVLSRRVFLEHFCKLGKYCSPFLLNAILALASHLVQDTSFDHGKVDGVQSGEPFFARAKDYLEAELQHPTVVTVQGLALMAEREAFAGRGVRAGLYFAMCGRLVTTLGLHLDASTLVRQGVISEEDNYLRSRTFWGVWAADKQFSSVLGQPCSIRLPHIACRYPAYWDQEDFDWWDSLETGRFVPVTQFSMQRGSLQISNLVRNMAFIYLHGMEHIYWQSNSAATADGTGLDILEANMQRTRQAMQSLPQLGNQQHGRELPGLLMVYLSYHHHIITMNRPFIADFDHGHSHDSPRTRCRSSASSIVHLLSLFRDATSSGLRVALNNVQHGLILAAGVLIVEMRLLQSEDAKQGVLADLLQVLAFLEELSAWRPAAAKSLAHLRTLAASPEIQTLVERNHGPPADIPPAISSAPSQRWENTISPEANAIFTTSFLDALQNPSSSFWQAQDFLSTDLFGLGNLQDPLLSLPTDFGELEFQQ